jgi:hypothetical protein
MWRVKLKWILPPMQLAIAAVLMWHWGYVAYLPKGSDSPYVPTSRFICDGINAPAVLLSNFFKALLPKRWQSFEFWSISSLHGDVLPFLACILLLWYLVGRELDRRRSTADGTSVKRSADVLLNSFLVAWGVLLTIFSLANFSDFQGLSKWGNFVGNIIEGSLSWAWSLILIIIPGLNLMNAIQSKNRVP